MVKFIKELFGEKEIGRTLAAVLGTLVFALGINLFVVPVHVYSGGIMGICQVIRTVLARFFHIDFGNIDIAGIIYYIANIPLFFLAFRTMGKLFFVKTMICTVMMTIFLTVIPIPPQLLVNDVLTCCLIGKACGCRKATSCSSKRLPKQIRTLSWCCAAAAPWRRPGRTG